MASIALSTARLASLRFDDPQCEHRRLYVGVEWQRHPAIVEFIGNPPLFVDRPSATIDVLQQRDQCSIVALAASEKRRNPDVKDAWRCSAHAEDAKTTSGHPRHDEEPRERWLCNGDQWHRCTTGGLQ